MRFGGACGLGVGAFDQGFIMSVSTIQITIRASFKTLVFGAYDFSLAPTFQITLIGNSLTQSSRILTGYIAIR
jgi:hypothetical protein